MSDAVLSLQVLDQLRLYFELPGAPKHVAGETVGLELVNVQRLQILMVFTTVAAAESLHLRLGHTLVPLGGVTIQL